MPISLPGAGLIQRGQNDARRHGSLANPDADALYTALPMAAPTEMTPGCLANSGCIGRALPDVRFDEPHIDIQAFRVSR